MQNTGLPAELERRIKLLENPENQGRDYDAAAWIVLIALGVVLPIVSLWLGRV